MHSLRYIKAIYRIHKNTHIHIQNTHIQKEGEKELPFQIKISVGKVT